MKYKSLNLSLIALFSFFIGTSFFSQNAYAAYSASISRASSGTITLSDGSGGSIKPSSTGTLGTGSDVVTVSSNCSAGYNLYVSAISGGSTNLTTSGGLDYIPSTTTATGSEAALPKDTWGIGKDGVTFSKLQSYSEDLSTMSPLYMGSGNKDYTIYYGVNVSTAKTPGTYTGDVLYTVLMNSACTSYTLNFNDNGATTNNLSSKELEFGSKLNLADISSTDKIAKTGYTLTGWKDQNNNSYGITGEVDINPNDLSIVTLIAQWEINSHTVTINKGTNVTTVSGANTYTYDSTVTISATAFSTGYHFNNWTINSGGITLYSNSTMTTQSTTTTPAYFKMPDTDVTITANAAANTYTINFNGQGGTVTTSSISGTYGNNITTPEASYSGYNLVGWSRTAYTAGQGSADYATTSTTSLSVSTLASDANVAKTNGATISLYAVWESSVQDCSDTVHPTTTTGCKMKDNSIWIYGNNGDVVKWNTICTESDKCESTTYCPSGYTLPTRLVYDTLVSKQGSGSQLYSTLGLSSNRYFWSTTLYGGGNAFNLYVTSSSADSSLYSSVRTYSYHVLCYKSAS